MAWGVTNEAEAIKAFTAKIHLEVVETGVWLDESGVLGASPVGLVGEDHVLEVIPKKESCLLAPSARANVLSQKKLLLFCCLDK